MKKVFLLAIFMPYMAWSQIIEDFESGNLVNWKSDYPSRWQADRSSSITGEYSLHHVFDNPEAGTDRIATELSNLRPGMGTTTWSFTVKHGYDPSSTNNWAVFLMADAGPDRLSVTAGTRGYALGVNISGSDDTLRLVKIDNGILRTVVRCRINWQTDVGYSTAVRVAAERSQEGDWSVSLKRMTGESMGSFTGHDPEIFNIGWFGIIYRYTSTKDRLLWIDDIRVSGTFISDNEPPAIIKQVCTGRKSVELTFNEPLKVSLFTDSTFMLMPDAIAEKVSATGNSFTLFFNKEFVNKSENEIIIKKVCDLYGNCADDTILTFIPAWPEAGDVLITEIMFDPVPEVGLPGREYLELTNTTGFSFGMEGWKLIAGTQEFDFPADTIRPGEIMVMCDEDDAHLFSVYGRVAAFRQFPALSDEGKIICIADSSSLLLHGVEYSPQWYSNSLKAEGGWSLEMTDTRSPFTERGNWTASVSAKGGTPGSANSVRGTCIDVTFKGLGNVFPVDSLHLRIDFSEPVINYRSLTEKVKTGDLEISEIMPADPLLRTFLAELDGPLQKHTEYTLEIPVSFSDFEGNHIERNTFRFGLTEEPEAGDIKFNELLFNPFPGRHDLIEFYNCSKKVIDASRLQMISVDDETSDSSELVLISHVGRCIMPGSYYAVTPGVPEICSEYPSSVADNIYELQYLPPMPDENGHLMLFNRQLNLIDEVRYNEKMHYPLLSSQEGVSLEKTGPCSFSGTAIAWHSASGNAGWATPGTVNSVFIEVPSVVNEITLSSTRISPDNDGFEDILSIRFNPQGTGTVVSLTVFDESGNRIKELASNVLAAPEDSFIWDGTADDGSPVRRGIYIIFASLFDDNGRTATWKKVCAVVR